MIPIWLEGLGGSWQTRMGEYTVYLRPANDGGSVDSGYAIIFAVGMATVAEYFCSGSAEKAQATAVVWFEALEKGKKRPEITQNGLGEEDFERIRAILAKIPQDALAMAVDEERLQRSLIQACLNVTYYHEAVQRRTADQDRLYDDMVDEAQHALKLLEEQGGQTAASLAL